MAKFMLDLKKPGNYGFFDPSSNANFTVRNPGKDIPDNMVSDGIKNAVRFGILIDVDNFFGLKNEPKKAKQEEHVQADTADNAEAKPKQKKSQPKKPDTKKAAEDDPDTGAKEEN